MESEILNEMHRSMIKNFLDTVILAKLRNSSPLSGYDIIGFINKKFDVFISPGTIYAVLYSMERKGLIRGQSTEGKRLYVLTKRGTETINVVLKSEEEVQRFMRAILNV